jgi:hypothetical protein
LHGLGDDEAVEVADGDFAEDLVALGGLIAPEDLEALTFEADAATVLVNGGGGQG